MNSKDHHRRCCSRTRNATSIGLQLVAAADQGTAVGIRCRRDRIERTKTLASSAICKRVRTLGQLRLSTAVELLDGSLTAETSGWRIDALAARGSSPTASRQRLQPSANDSLALSAAECDVHEGRRRPVELPSGRRRGTGRQSRPARNGCSTRKQKKQLPASSGADAGQLLRNSPYQDLRKKARELFPAAGEARPEEAALERGAGEAHRQRRRGQQGLRSRASRAKPSA